MRNRITTTSRKIFEILQEEGLTIEEALKTLDHCKALILPNTPCDCSKKDKLTVITLKE